MYYWWIHVLNIPLLLPTHHKCGLVSAISTWCLLIRCHLPITVQNLPRNVRYKPENIILVGVIMPGPKEASLNINPYLSPLVLALQQAWNEGFTGWPAYGLFWENWVLHSGTLHWQNAFVVAPFKFISICKQFLVLYVATLQNIIVHRSGQDHMATIHSWVMISLQAHMILQVLAGITRGFHLMSLYQWWLTH